MKLSAFFLMGLCALAWSTLGAPRVVHASDEAAVSAPSDNGQNGQNGQSGQDCDDNGRQGTMGDHQQDGKHKCEPTRTADFNIVCFYKKHEHKEHGDKDQDQGQGQRPGDDDKDKGSVCKVSSTFAKRITADGGEIMDRSPDPGQGNPAELPMLSVECGPEAKYNDHARRWTDLLSTRIQGLTGPHPAIYLPRGALHEGTHVADSYLEVESGIPGDPVRMYGKCHIWTGRP
jgi:hypothetical protein